jgi:hypothetical protein
MDACGEFGAQEPRIGGLVRDTADRRQPEVDGRGRILPLLEVNAIAEDHRPVEGEARLRTVPRDELANRIVAGLLAAPRTQAAEDG